MRNFATTLALGLALWLFPAEQVALAQEMTALPEAERSPPLPPLPDGFTVVNGMSVDVYGHPAQLTLLTEVARRANKKLPELAATLDLPLGGHVVVYVAGSEAEFMGLQPGRPPEWAEGTAWPDRGAVFLKSPGLSDNPTAMFKVLDHELTHILLGRAFAPYKAPHWLEEGIARNMAGEQGPDDTRRIAEGLSHGGLYSLENLHVAFPRDSVGASLAYAESADFVAFLRAEHGDDALRALIVELRNGSTIDKAVYVATGETLPALDARWRARFTGVPFFLSGAFDIGAFGFGVVALFALFKRRQRLDARMAKMKADEAEREALLTQMKSPRAGSSWPVDSIPERAVGRVTRRRN